MITTTVDDGVLIRYVNARPAFMTLMKVHQQQHTRSNCRTWVESAAICSRYLVVYVCILLPALQKTGGANLRPRLLRPLFAYSGVCILFPFAPFAPQVDKMGKSFARHVLLSLWAFPDHLDSNSFSFGWRVYGVQSRPEANKTVSI
jgi:hypothetical protein